MRREELSSNLTGLNSRFAFHVVNLIDQILNLAALLLWLSWRSSGLVPRVESSVLSIASALKKAEPSRTAGVLYLLSLFGLLGLRSVVYWHLGKGVNWTPELDLVAISLPFRSDHFHLMLIFSFLSFGLVLVIFYSWLLLISVANRKVADTEPLQKLVRLHLGWIERFPAVIKLCLPVASSILIWCCLSPALVQLGIVPNPASRAHLWQQAAVLGLASFLAWKTFLLGILLLHMLNSYVYLGNASVLSFVTLTARNVLRVLAWLPTSAGRLDLAPFAGIALVLFAAWSGAYWLPKLYQQLPF